MSRSRGYEAAERFEAWASSQSLSYFREISNSNRTQLMRTCIMDAVGIDRPALRQNARIQKALVELENRLRDKGVLAGLPVNNESSVAKKLTLPLRPTKPISSSQEAERMRRLEKELAAKDAELAGLRPLRFENQRLKQLVHDMRGQLRRFGALDEILQESGRLPR